MHHKCSGCQMSLSCVVRNFETCLFTNASGHRFSASLSRSFLRPQSSVFLCSSMNHKTERTLNHPNTHPKGNSPSNSLLDVVIANNIYMAEARGAACYHQIVLATRASCAQLGKILHLFKSSVISLP